MIVELTERQRKIVLQSLINYEYDNKKAVCNAELMNHWETAERYQQYTDEVHEVLEQFDVK